jgi:hypothetical protein
VSRRGWLVLLVALVAFGSRSGWTGVHLVLVLGGLLCLWLAFCKRLARATQSGIGARFDHGLD